MVNLDLEAFRQASDEDAEQEAVIRFCQLAGVPIVHIPNEGKRTRSYAMRLKRLGMSPGFPDLFVPMACGGYHGLMIELKTVGNRPTEKQKEWIAELKKNGYAACVRYGAENAIKTINQYRRGCKID